MLRNNFGRSHTYIWMIWYKLQAFYGICRSVPGNPREVSGYFILLHVFGESLQPLPDTAHYHCNCLAAKQFSLCWSTNIRAVSLKRLGFAKAFSCLKKSSGLAEPSLKISIKKKLSLQYVWFLPSDQYCDMCPICTSLTHLLSSTPESRNSLSYSFFFKSWNGLD